MIGEAESFKNVVNKIEIRAMAMFSKKLIYSAFINKPSEPPFT
jgi:hypothetical protein